GLAFFFCGLPPGTINNILANPIRCRAQHQVRSCGQIRQGAHPGIGEHFPTYRGRLTIGDKRRIKSETAAATLPTHAAQKGACSEYGTPSEPAERCARSAVMQAS